MTTDIAVTVTVTSITGEQHTVQPGSRHHSCATAGYVVARIPETGHEEYDAAFWCGLHAEAFDLPTLQVCDELASGHRYYDVESLRRGAGDLVYCRKCGARKPRLEMRRIHGKGGELHKSRWCLDCAEKKRLTLGGGRLTPQRLASEAAA